MFTQVTVFLRPSKSLIGELHNALMAGRDLLIDGWHIRCMVNHRNLDCTKSSGAGTGLLSESEGDAEAVLHHVRVVAPGLLMLTDHRA